MMLHTEFPTRGRFCLLVFIFLMLTIQFVVFLATKGHLTPDVESSGVIPGDILCSQHWSDGPTFCYFVIQNRAAFSARLRAEYEDGYIRYSDDGMGMGRNYIPAIPTTEDDDVARICVEACTFAGWSTINCFVVPKDTFGSIYFTVMPGVLLFEFLFVLSFVVDLWIWAINCCPQYGGGDPHINRLVLISTLISIIDLVVNAVHPESVYPSVIFLLTLGMVRFIWILTVSIYQYRQAWVIEKWNQVGSAGGV
jgi:hypothetical protein